MVRNLSRFIYLVRKTRGLTILRKLHPKLMYKNVENGTALLVLFDVCCIELNASGNGPKAAELSRDRN